MELLAGIATPELCLSQSPDRFNMLSGKVGLETVRTAELLITLHHMDEGWAEHLFNVARVREGIHLVGLGGLKPFDEFVKQIGGSFSELLTTIDDRIVETFERIDITANGIDVEKEGLSGPSSTWTYLVNDQAMSALKQMLFGDGSYATAAGAALVTGPLLFAWSIHERLKRRRSR